MSFLHDTLHRRTIYAPPLIDITWLSLEGKVMKETVVYNKYKSNGDWTANEIE